jgi:NAD(P)H-nitrite reductase large subunit
MQSSRQTRQQGVRLMRIAVIGAGPAGITAAENICRLDASARCTVFSMESFQPYSPPLLYNYFLDGADIFWKGSDFANFTLKTSCKVVEIDRIKRIIYTDSMYCHSFDKLIFAVGADCYLPIADTHFSNSYNFKSLTSASQLIKDLQSANSKPRVIVIGAGFIGIEISLLLNKLNAEVILIEQADQILPDMADPLISRHLNDLLQKSGITILLQSQVTQLKGKTLATEAVLSNGNVAFAEFFVISTGLRPDVGIAKRSGIKTNRGICIDETLRTSDASIFAIGDCAELTSESNVNASGYSNFFNATEQARICAANVLGGNLAYEKPPRANSIKHLSVPLMIAGARDGEKHIWKNEKQLRIVFTKNNHICGFQLFNSENGAGVLNGAMKASKDISHCIATIASPHFNYSSIG